MHLKKYIYISIVISCSIIALSIELIGQNIGKEKSIYLNIELITNSDKNPYLRLHVKNNSNKNLFLVEPLSGFNRIVFIDQFDKEYPFYMDNNSAEIKLTPGEEHYWECKGIWSFKELIERNKKGKVQVYWQIFDKHKPKKPEIPSANLSDYFQEYRSEVISLN